MKYVDLAPEATADLQERFLTAYMQTGSLKRAASQVPEITTYAHYRWLVTDPAYSLNFRLAQEVLADQLEAAAYARAVVGVERPVYQGGEWVGDVTEYSDNLLMFMLRGLRPDKYREKVTIVTEQAVDAEITRLEAELKRRGVEIVEQKVIEGDHATAVQEG